MNSEFVPYNLAIELKELGFDEPCVASWDETTMKDMQTGKETPIIALNQLNGYKQYNSDHDYNKSLGNKSGISAPLYQQTFRFFREKYGLYADLFIDDNKSFGFMISYFVEEGRSDKPIDRQFNTYEESELACLVKLIGIVKNK